MWLDGRVAWGGDGYAVVRHQV